MIAVAVYSLYVMKLMSKNISLTYCYNEITQYIGFNIAANLSMNCLKVPVMMSNACKKTCSAAAEKFNCEKV